MVEEGYTSLGLQSTLRTAEEKQRPDAVLGWPHAWSTNTAAGMLSAVSAGSAIAARIHQTIDEA